MRSSESFGQLAAALAKAQAALTNPEKSMTGTIRGEGHTREAQTFRYAPLSSGLEIIRKTLGQHEIATMQTTALDHATGMVSLTTMLAHSSGEWIASDWPVCQIAEVRTPHRMGAALTYARRYALFTLAGIAGDDDLDAPDLLPSTERAPSGGPGSAADRGRSEIGSRPGRSGSRPAPKPNGRTAPVPRPAPLTAVLSASLCNQLIAELAGIETAEDAANWAARTLSAKNSLIAADAGLLETVFRERLNQIGAEIGAPPAVSPAPSTEGAGQGAVVASAAISSPGPLPRGKVDKSVLSIGELKRFRDKAHLRFVASKACLVCGREPSDAHHLRFSQSRGVGHKVSDEFTVPLCRVHHREVHRATDERGWWQRLGIEPADEALRLWMETRGSRELAAESLIPPSLVARATGTTT